MFTSLITFTAWHSIYMGAGKNRRYDRSFLEGRLRAARRASRDIFTGNRRSRRASPYRASRDGRAGHPRIRRRASPTRAAADTALAPAADASREPVLKLPNDMENTRRCFCLPNFGVSTPHFLTPLNVFSAPKRCLSATNCFCSKSCCKLQLHYLAHIR